MKKQIKKENLTIQKDSFENAITGIMILGVIGGRVGNTLFYESTRFFDDPLMIFYIWQGGMSFHGGLLAALVAAYYYTKQMQIPYLKLTDLAVVAAPIGIGFGRLANLLITN